MKKIVILFVSALFASCTSNNQQLTNDEITNFKSEIDSLKNELYQYKEKYGELKKIDVNNKEFGIWKTSYYIDDFGEPTKEGFVGTLCEGTFSNSATTNSDLGVKFLIDKSNIRIQLYEYNRNHPIKGEGFLEFKAKRNDGEMFDFKTYNFESGDNIVEKQYYKKLISFLQKGGEIKFIAQTSSSYSLSKYKFVLTDSSYLEEALSSLQ